MKFSGSLSRAYKPASNLCPKFRAEIVTFRSEVPVHGLPRCTSGKEPACQCRRYETQVQSLHQEDPLEEGTATHSSVLAWEIPWTEEPGGPTVHRVAQSWT